MSVRLESKRGGALLDSFLGIVDLKDISKIRCNYLEDLALGVEGSTVGGISSGQHIY
jgi:hypothetical protein